MSTQDRVSLTLAEGVVIVVAAFLVKAGLDRLVDSWWIPWLGFFLAIQAVVFVIAWLRSDRR